MPRERGVPEAGAKAVATGIAAQSTQGAAAGFIDQAGWGDALGGLVLLGWAYDRQVDRTPEAHPISLEMSGAQLVGRAFVGVFERDDVDQGVGLIIHIPHATRLSGILTGAQLAQRVGNLRLQASMDMQRLPPAEIFRSIEGLRLSPQGAAAHLRSILDRPRPHAGNALADAGMPVHVEVDEIIVPSPGSAVVMGWCLDPLNMVASVHLRCGWYRSPPVFARHLRLPRTDVLDAFGPRYGLTHAQHGFLAYAETDHPAPTAASNELALEICMHDGTTWFKALPAPQRQGLPAMLRVLGAARLPEDGLDAALTEILAPPLRAINRARLARPCRVTEHRFGEALPSPLVSLVIPLYGRIDFMHHQLAQFSAGAPLADEIIYVLDDPRLTEVALRTARIGHALFQVPFRLLLLEENRGFGPASNIGLRHATGEFVYFLNSDVFPITLDWTAMLADALKSDPGLGCVGPVLCFADGSVQHMGMVLEPRPEANDWRFPRHTGKGRRPPAAAAGVIRVPLITGAALMMRREVVSRLGGFDEQYAIGDFEDVDLCVRAGQMGLGCAVHTGVTAYHLERQSQGDSADLWRTNLTLFNAWLFRKTEQAGAGAMTRKAAAAGPSRVHAG